MNSKLLLLASSVALASATDLTFAPPSGWTFGSTASISWTASDATFYGADVLDISLYGPVFPNTNLNTLTPSATLVSAVDVKSFSSASFTLPSNLAAGTYYVCATEGTKTQMRCTERFNIAGSAIVEDDPTTEPAKTVPETNANASNEKENGASTLANGAGVASAIGLFAYFFL